MSLGIKQVFYRKCLLPVWFICSVNFLFMALRATRAGILVKRVLSSKDTKVLSGTTFCSFRDSANPLLFLTNGKLLPQEHCRIYVRNFAKL